MAKPKQKPPHGMEHYDLGGQEDLGALSEEQQQTLNDFKIKMRIGHENYLREHPEVQCMLGDFLRIRRVQDFGSGAGSGSRNFLRSGFSAGSNHIDHST